MCVFNPVGMFCSQSRCGFMPGFFKPPGYRAQVSRSEVGYTNLILVIFCYSLRIFLLCQILTHPTCSPHTGGFADPDNHSSNKVCGACDKLYVTTNCHLLHKTRKGFRAYQNCEGGIPMADRGHCDTAFDIESFDSKLRQHVRILVQHSL